MKSLLSPSNGSKCLTHHFSNLEPPNHLLPVEISLAIRNVLSTASFSSLVPGGYILGLTFEMEFREFGILLLAAGWKGI